MRKRVFTNVILPVCLQGWCCMRACVCAHAHVECFYVCTCHYVAQLNRGAWQDIVHQQLEEPNCMTDIRVGRSPSSHPVHTGKPFRDDIVWWTATCPLITANPRSSFRTQRTIRATGGGNAVEKKKHGLEKCQDYTVVSGPQCKCLCFSFESGLRWGLSQMGNIGYSPRTSALVS